MIGTWHNNRISEKLNKEYSKDFSICDIDGVVRCNYYAEGIKKTRFIIYESKNEFEKSMGISQLSSLKLIRDSIDWKKFDEFSGVYVLKIIDLESKIIWYTLDGVEIRKTTFKEVYNIFSCKK
jgi:hypothetical protein